MHACMHACTHARTHARTHTRTHARTRTGPRVRAVPRCQLPSTARARGPARWSTGRLASPAGCLPAACGNAALRAQGPRGTAYAAGMRVRARARACTHPPPLSPGRTTSSSCPRAPSPFKSDMNKFVVITSCVVKPRCVGAQNYDSFRRKIHKLPNFCARRWHDCAARTVQARRDPSEPDHDCYHRVTI